MKVLLVDDSRMMRTIQKNVLNALGNVEFSEAGDGIEALAVLASPAAPFGLVVVDWNMPNMDGITLVRKIRETDKKTPLIMVTTESEKDRILEALKAGVNNFALKPFTPVVLLEKVKKTLGIAA